MNFLIQHRIKRIIIAGYEELLAALAEHLVDNKTLCYVFSDGREGPRHEALFKKIQQHLDRNFLLNTQEITHENLANINLHAINHIDLRVILSKARHLDVWSFANKKLDAKCVLFSPISFPIQPNLVRLNLAGNVLGDEGAKNIGEILRSKPSLLPSLTYLNLSHNKIREMGLRYLIDAQSNVDNPVPVLDLSENLIVVCGVTLEELILKNTAHSSFEIRVSGNSFLESTDRLFVNSAPSILSSVAVDREEKKSTQRPDDIKSMGFKFGFFHTAPLEIFSVLNDDSTKKISVDRWAVALGCRKGTEHAVLYLEGMRPNGQRFLNRYEITTTDNFVGKAKVRTTAWDPGRFYNDKDKHNIWPYAINRIQGETLLGRIQRNNIDIDFSICNSTASKVNCLKWCRENLTYIDLQPPENPLPSLAAKGWCVIS